MKKDNDICEALKPHILPEFQKAFREIVAGICSGKTGDIPPIRFRGVRDPFRELRRMFLEEFRKAGNTTVEKKPIAVKDAERMKVLWFEELTDFDNAKGK